MTRPFVLCDVDGVLVESKAATERAWSAWGERHGLAFAEVAPRMHGIPSREAIASLAPGLDAAAEAEEIERQQTRDTEGVVAIPGASELLAAWPAARFAAVTSATRPLAEARLTAAGLALPATMVTAELVDRGKPDPEAYLLGASLLGARPPECVVLEDAPAGVAAGLAAGMRVIALTTTHPASALTGANAVVADLRGIRSVLDAL